MWRTLFPPLCIICRRYTSSGTICQSCRPVGIPGQIGSEFQRHGVGHTMPAPPLLYLWRYHGAAGSFIRIMKYQPSPKLVTYAANQLCEAIFGPWREQWAGLDSPLLVPIPSLPSNVRLRMLDISCMLCARLAKGANARMANLLVTRDIGYSQKSRSLQGRLQSARQRLSIRSSLSPGPQSLMLIDDVVTSGASLRVAAELLDAAGWRVRAAIALAAAHERPLALEQM